MDNLMHVIRRYRSHFACLMLATSLISQQVLALPDSTRPAPPRPSLLSLKEPFTPPSTRALTIKGYKTPSDGKILFIRTPGVNMFDVLVSFPAGSSLTPHQPGLAALTLSLLNEGVDGKDVSAILETFDSLGATLQTRINHDRTTIHLRSLSDESLRTPALELFAQLVGKPSLNAPSVVRVKNEMSRFLDDEDQSPEKQAGLMLDSLLFPQHGYAQSIWGTRAGIASITPADARAFHDRTYTERNLSITLVGDLTEKEAQQIGVQIASALPRNPSVAAMAPPADPTFSNVPTHVERDLDQVYLQLGQLAVRRGHPDYIALRTASYIFGDRLSAELRGRRGITYDVNTQVTAREAQGIVKISLQIQPQFVDATLSRIEEMFREFLADGPTPTELADEKLGVTGRTYVRNASNAGILRQLHEIDVHNLPLELEYASWQTGQLSVASIKAALATHFNPDRWAKVSVGPKTEQKPLPAPLDTDTQTLCRASNEIMAS